MPAQRLTARSSATSGPVGGGTRSSATSGPVADPCPPMGRAKMGHVQACSCSDTQLQAMRGHRDGRAPCAGAQRICNVTRHTAKVAEQHGQHPRVRVRVTGSGLAKSMPM
eukprot:365164-Chlamydomonas_euryale.AAC.4